MVKKKVEELTIEENWNNALIPVDKQPYEIPQNWCWVRLDSIVSIVTGKKNANYADDNGAYTFFTCAMKPVKCNNYSFSGESLIVPGNGIIGYVFYYDGKFEAYQRTYVLQSFNKKINMKYLYYHFFCFWKDYNKFKQYGSVINFIKMKNFLNYPVPLPPLAEQERIVNKLDNYISKLDEAKEKLEKVVDTYNYRKNLILYRAFTGQFTKNWRKENPNIESVDILLEKINQEKQNLKLNKTQKDRGFIKEEEIPYNIPNNWKWIKLKDIILYDVGGGTPSTKIDSYWAGNIPWMSVKDFANNKDGVIIDTIDHISEEGVKNSSTNIIDENAIILCVRMGLGKYAKLSRPMAINQDLRAIWLSKNINERFFLYYYSTLKIIGRGTTVEGIKKEQLFAKFIPLPPLEEQKEIVKILDSVLSKEKQVKKIAEKETERVENLKKNILTRAFGGLLGTNDPNEENSIELLKSVL